MAGVPDENPWRGMKIKNGDVLETVEGRAACPKCKKSRKYFCYTCYVPMAELESHVPKVKLPIKIDIIKHANEIDGKSTAAHAAVIAPDDVTIYTYPCIPDYTSEKNVVLIFPGKNALSIQEYVDKHSNTQKSNSEDDEPLAKRSSLSSNIPINRAVFIDSTWNQSRGIYKDQRLREIPCVVIQSRISQFWRHQHGSPRWFLATIEAVHQFLVEVHIICKLGCNEIIQSEEQQGTSGRGVAESASDSSKELREPSDKSASEDSQINSSDTADQISISNPKEDDEEIDAQNKNSSDEKILAKSKLPDKQPSKFVKNLALCRGIRTDSGEDPGINLCGPDQWEGKYGGDYDNLLFFFKFMYYKIHSLYDHENLRSYQRDMV